MLLGTFAPISSNQTVRRVRASIFPHSDQNVATETVLGAIGFGVFDDTALGVGVASISDPITDVSDDFWFSYTTLHVRFVFRTAVGADSQVGPVEIVDSKAMRKVPLGKSVGVVVANSNATFGMAIQVIIRVYSMQSR